MKEYKIYDVPVKQTTLLLFAIIAWIIFGLLIFYFDEFREMITTPRRRYGLSRRSLLPNSEIWAYLIPGVVLLAAGYFSREMLNFKPKAPEVKLKISEEGIWDQIFGLFKWEELWYFSTLHEEDSGNDFLILKCNDEREIKIETGSLATSLTSIRHYINETNTNENLKDAGHLVDDSKYDRHGNVLN